MEIALLFSTPKTTATSYHTASNNVLENIIILYDIELCYHINVYMSKLTNCSSQESDRCSVLGASL